MSKQAKVDWEVYEGAVSAVVGDHEIEISALQDRSSAAKWGESFTSGREWFVFDAGNNIVAKGRSRDLREAKRDALATLSPEAR